MSSFGVAALAPGAVTRQAAATAVTGAIRKTIFIN